MNNKRSVIIKMLKQKNILQKCRLTDLLYLVFSFKVLAKNNPTKFRGTYYKNDSEICQLIIKKIFKQKKQQKNFTKVKCTIDGIRVNISTHLYF